MSVLIRSSTRRFPSNAALPTRYGQPVQLREYSGKKPVVLAFVYFTCPMLCNQVEQALVGTLKMISFNPGTDYDVVFISFDPSDTPDEALKKKHEAMSRFARPATEPGWHFLTGTQRIHRRRNEGGRFPLQLRPEDQAFRAMPAASCC